MSKLEQLINELCPNGVEWKKLGNIAQSIKTGLNPRQNFKLNDIEASNFYVTVKEITTGKVCFSEKTDRIDEKALKIIQNRSKLERGDVLFSGIGTIGKVAIVDISTENWNCSESIFLIKPNQNLLNSRFLMHILRSDIVVNQYKSQSVGSTLKGIRMATLSTLLIPIPPLPVQEEIVRILDIFTELTTEFTTELTTELTMRKQHYEYYRDSLLTFGDEVEWKALGEVGKVQRGASPRPISKYITESENGVPWIKIGDTILGSKYVHKTEQRITKEGALKSRILKKGAFIISNSMSFGRPYILDIDGAIHDGWASISEFESKLNPDFFYHYLSSQIVQYYWESKINSGSVSNLNSDIIKNLKIPIPSLKEQERIVAILDKFDTLTNSISEGLPYEIELRKKQYEYYRDKLLTFKKLEKID